MLRTLTRPTALEAMALLALTMFLWAGNHVLGRWAADHIPPMTLAFFRWSIAALVILPLAAPALRRDRAAIRTHWQMLALLGIMGSGLYNTIQYIALTETTVSNAAIINSWAPVLIALLGAALFGDPLRPLQAGGILISLVGVGVVMLHGDLTRLAALAFNRGDLVMLGGTTLWALYTALLRLRPPVSALSFAAVTFSVAGVVNLPLAAFEYANGQVVQWSWLTVGAIFYAAVLASVAGYYLYTVGVEALGPTRSGAFIHLIPLFATVQALVLIGEAPEPYHALGFGLILSGVALAQRGRRSA